MRGSENVARHQFQGLIIFAIGLVLTSGSLAVLHARLPEATRNIELLVLVSRTSLPPSCDSSLLRWVFRATRRTTRGGEIAR